MKRLSFTTLMVLLGFTFVVTSCDDDDDNNNNPEFIATQADLNKATNAFDLNIRGMKYGDGTIAHNGTPMSPDSTIRDIYTNLENKDDPITVGTIITKHTYLADFSEDPDNPKRGDRQVTFAMIKREAGFNDALNDWEFVMMPNNTGNDFAVNPNGTLPGIENTDMRGLMAGCVSCHGKATDGELGLFIR